MKKTMSVKGIMDTIIPISRFNRGEANKIFEEVNDTGVKLVLKNNIPACVLVQPERYEAMIEALEDYALYFEAEQRIKDAGKNDFLSKDEVYSELGITESDMNDVEVEIE